jgi:hypothetical protein
MRKLYSLAIGGFLAMLIWSVAETASPDISAQRLLSSWQEGEPGMRMVAEMIASAFASGFSWGGNAAGKQVYCAQFDVKGHEIMSAFEGFLRDHPQMASEPYGAAMAATLSTAFQCTGQ